MHTRKISSALVVVAALLASLGCGRAMAQERQQATLLNATQTLQDFQGMPDRQVPDRLLAQAYGIAVIPGVTNLAFVFGGRYGKGVLVVRDKLSNGWSNPSFITMGGGSFGLQIGAEGMDIVLLFMTRSSIEGITGGKLTLGAGASVAAGPVGRQGASATDTSLSEIYSYAQTRGLFGGLAFDGSVITIDKKANAIFYGRPGITASDIFMGQVPTPQGPAQGFLARLAASTGSAGLPQAAPQNIQPAAPTAAPPPAGSQPAAAPPGDAARTYPLESQPLGGPPN